MTYPTTQPLKIKIGGTDRTSVIPVDGIVIRQVISKAIDTASFVVQDAGDLGISELDEVIISNPAEDLRYFAGYLTILEKRLVTPIRVDLHCYCQDYTFLLERVIVNEVYESQSDADIIADLFANYLSDVQASTYVEELVSSSHLTKIIFNRVTLRRAVEALAAVGGGDWYVDCGPGPGAQLAYLHYFAQESEVASYSISDSPDIEHSSPCENLRVMRDATDHLNMITVIGGHYLSSDTDFILAADGVQTEVLLPYEFEPPDGESKPKVYGNTNTDDDPSWTERTVGLDYTDSLADYQVLFNKQQKLLKFATAPSELKRSIKITARYEVPLRQRGRNQVSYDGYGRWLEGLLVDTDIVSKEVARKRVKGAIAERDVGDVITCLVREPGLTVGERIHLVNSVAGLNGWYNLQVVTTRFDPGGRARLYLEMS